MPKSALKVPRVLNVAQRAQKCPECPKVPKSAKKCSKVPRVPKSAKKCSKMLRGPKSALFKRSQKCPKVTRASKSAQNGQKVPRVATPHKVLFFLGHPVVRSCNLDGDTSSFLKMTEIRILLELYLAETDNSIVLNQYCYLAKVSHS